MHQPEPFHESAAAQLAEKHSHHGLLEERGCPAWFWILLGIALVGVVPSAPPAAMSPAELSHKIPHPEQGEHQRSSGALSVRRLRQIPGIGQLRALAIARARWRAERDGIRFELLEVPGIGPAIAAKKASYERRLQAEGLAGRPESF